MLLSHCFEKPLKGIPLYSEQPGKEMGPSPVDREEGTPHALPLGSNFTLREESF